MDKPWREKGGEVGRVRGGQLMMMIIIIKSFCADKSEINIFDLYDLITI